MWEAGMAATESGGLHPDLCHMRAAECRALIAITDKEPARIMLEHLAVTWERLAQRLMEPG
jgi:hypothetical protein